MLMKYLKQRRRVIFAFAVFVLIFAVSFALYHLPLGAVAYPALLCAVATLAFAVYDIRKVRARHQELVQLAKLTGELIEVLPQTDSIESEDYQQIIRMLQSEQKALMTDAARKQSDLIDYYTTWGHQIKTPIAAMRLHLQNEDSAFSRALSLDLMRIEQYVETLLAYLRLGSDSTDYLFREYDLDSIVRPCVRRFSGEFIARHLALSYAPLNRRVITDEKWLAFVIEQVLSNAIKYTREGSVSIYMEGDTLCIRDTGIGIAPEDLPRIFENGYTGMNGRIDKKASGLGLHLCRRICGKLGHTIAAESKVGAGTIITIGLAQKKCEGE